MDDLLEESTALYSLLRSVCPVPSQFQNSPEGLMKAMRALHSVSPSASARVARPITAALKRLTDEALRNGYIQCLSNNDLPSAQVCLNILRNSSKVGSETTVTREEKQSTIGVQRSLPVQVKPGGCLPPVREEICTGTVKAVPDKLYKSKSASRRAEEEVEIKGSQPRRPLKNSGKSKESNSGSTSSEEEVEIKKTEPRRTFKNSGKSKGGNSGNTSSEEEVEIKKTEPRRTLKNSGKSKGCHSRSLSRNRKRVNKETVREKESDYSDSENDYTFCQKKEPLPNPKKKPLDSRPDSKKKPTKASGKSKSQNKSQSDQNVTETKSTNERSKPKVIKPEDEPDKPCGSHSSKFLNCLKELESSLLKGKPDPLGKKRPIKAKGRRNTSPNVSSQGCKGVTSCKNSKSTVKKNTSIEKSKQMTEPRRKPTRKSGGLQNPKVARAAKTNKKPKAQKKVVIPKEKTSVREKKTEESVIDTKNTEEDGSETSHVKENVSAKNASVSSDDSFLSDSEFEPKLDSLSSCLNSIKRKVPRPSGSATPPLNAFISAISEKSFSEVSETGSFNKVPTKSDNKNIVKRMARANKPKQEASTRQSQPTTSRIIKTPNSLKQIIRINNQVKNADSDLECSSFSED